MIFFATSSAAKTSPPPAVTGTFTTTANGFSSAMRSASARCAASSGPLGLMVTNSRSRPHRLKLWVNTSCHGANESSK